MCWGLGGLQIDTTEEKISEWEGVSREHVHGGTQGKRQPVYRLPRSGDLGNIVAELFPESWKSPKKRNMKQQ